MTLYEINQQGYKSLSNMIKSDVDKAIKELAENINSLNGKYFMMVCNELHYYTLFTWRGDIYKSYFMAEEVIDVAKTLGNIKDIEVQNDHTKIWIENNDECHAYIFFNYDKGVIEV